MFDSWVGDHPSSTLNSFYTHGQACWNSRTWSGQPSPQSSGECTPSQLAQSQKLPGAYCTPVVEDKQQNLDIGNLRSTFVLINVRIWKFSSDAFHFFSEFEASHYLSNTLGAAPVPLRHILERRDQAEGVVAVVTAIAQEEPVFLITPPTHQAEVEVNLGGDQCHSTYTDGYSTS